MHGFQRRERFNPRARSWKHRRSDAAAATAAAAAAAAAAATATAAAAAATSAAVGGATEVYMGVTHCTCDEPHLETEETLKGNLMASCGECSDWVQYVEQRRAHMASRLHRSF
jgi:hypothetical protein